MSAEVPNELWTLVLGKMEDVRDFARLQRLSKTFQSLVIKNCWIKVKSIAVRRIVEEDGEEAIQATVHTALRQEIHLPLTQAALLLDKLAQKATKTTAVSVSFLRMRDERHDSAMRRFFDALLTAKIKVNEFQMAQLHFPNCLTTAVPAMTRFLGANTQSLTSLNMLSSFDTALPVPRELVQVFQACRSLKKARLFDSPAVVLSVLQGQTQLQSLLLRTVLVSSWNRVSAMAVAVVESGSKLQELDCDEDILRNYLEEVRRRDRPLQSLTKLQVNKGLPWVPSLPWALFLNLELINICGEVDLNRGVEMAQSFLLHWSDAGVPKTLECRMGAMVFSNEVLQMAASAVQRTTGCQTRVLQPASGPLGVRIIFFQMGSATFQLRLSLGD